MPLIPKRPVSRRHDGRFDIAISDDEGALITNFANQLREMLMTRHELLARLNPTAYPEDPAHEREYQEMMQGDLIESRFAALDTIEQTLGESVLDEGQLTLWMQAVNALRLVIGTRLGITDDDGYGPNFDDDDPEAGLYYIYEYFGHLLSYIVDALSQALPES